MNELELKYHNDINEIQFKNFTLQELKVFFLFCAKLKDLGTNEASFSFYELKKIMDITKENDSNFGKLLSNTLTKILHIDFLLDNETEETKILLFSKYTIDKKGKVIFLQVNEHTKYLLNNLSEKFTLTHYSQINKFKSKYSLRLYTELKQFCNNSKKYKKELNGKLYNWRNFPIDEFKRLLDIPSSLRMRDIDKRVLTPAILEFEKNNFEVLYFKNKTGNKVSSILFYFKFIEAKNENDDIIEIIDEKDEIINNKITSDEELEKYFKSTFTDVNYSKKHKEVLEKLLKNNSLEYIKKYLSEQWEYVQNDKNILNKSAYFSKLILEEKAVYKNHLPADYEELKVEERNRNIESTNTITSLKDLVEKDITDYEVRKNITPEQIEQEVLFKIDVTEEEYNKIKEDWIIKQKEVIPNSDPKLLEVIFNASQSKKYNIINTKEEVNKKEKELHELEENIKRMQEEINKLKKEV